MYFRKTLYLNVWQGSQYISGEYIFHQPLHKKLSFPLRISWVNVTKSAGNCGFGHTY